MSVRILPGIALAAVVAVSGLSPAPAIAGTVTFAVFSEHAANGSGDKNFDWVGTTTSGSLITHSAFALVDFSYKDFVGTLPDALLGVQSADLTISATTTEHAFAVSGFDFQPFNQDIVLHFTRATPILYLGAMRSNLLTVTISPAASETAIYGGNGGHSLSLAADSANEVITYSSDFLNFSATNSRDLSLSFTAENPATAIVAHFFRSFKTDGVGSFDSDPAPTGMPEPASMLLLGAGAAGLAMARRRR